jgi:transposase
MLAGPGCAAYLCVMQITDNQTVPLEVHQEVLAKVADLEGRIAWFERQLFGVKSERFVPDIPGQLTLDFGDPGQAQALAESIKQIIAAHERTKVPVASTHQGRLAIPAGLPRVEEVVEPAGNLEGLVRIGEDISEVLEYTPGRIWVRRTVRPRYARPEAMQRQSGAEADAAGQNPPPQIIQAPIPDGPFPRFKAAVSLMVHILISKYVDHLPLYRIHNQFARHGLKIPDSTMGEWTKAAIDHLLPLYKLYEKLVFLAAYLQMDETTIKVLEDGKGKCHLGYIWAVFDPVDKLPFFFYQTGRDHKGAKEKLERFVGTLQCDGYSVYETLDKKILRLVLLNCMAHIRREFFEARDNDQARADTALTLIKCLYIIEKKARDQQMDHQQRLELRQKESLEIFDTLGEWLKNEYPKVLPSSKIGKAIAYATNRWDNMRRYLYDGTLEIDNNLVENIIRPIAIGRKNYLFAGSHDAAQRTAMIYTFFAACKHHDINPEIWLNDVLNRVYKHPINKLHELLPQFWKPKT